MVLTSIALKGRCNPYFVDSQGHGCKTYADMKYCRINGDYGENWNPYETFEYYAVNGEDATSCPQCGCQGNKITRLGSIQEKRNT